MPAYSKHEVLALIYIGAGRPVPKYITKTVRSRKLSENLNYTDDLLEDLQMALDAHIKTIDPEAEFSDDDLGDCETVGDILDLFEEKLTP